jgi:acetyl-CoA acetyltransferase
MEDMLFSSALTDSYNKLPMGITAENVVTMCIGGGQGIAAIVEALE